MPPITAILVDDNPSHTANLQLLLSEHCPQINLIATFSNPATALKQIPVLDPQLLFLDIEMPQMSGFQLLTKLKTYKGGVIFTTAHSGYALRAFKFSAVDYLIKPVEAGELKQAVKKFMASKQNLPTQNQLQQLSGNIDFLAQPVPGKIAVPTSDAIEIILLDEVEYFKADRNYTLIKRTGRKDVFSAKPLKDFEETLAGGPFMRIHMSYLVNLNKIERYVRGEGGYVVMNEGSQISVSRSNRQEFLQRING